jgi:hypothetical protein
MVDFKVVSPFDFKVSLLVAHPQGETFILDGLNIALKQLVKDNGFTHVADVHSIQKEYNQNASAIEEFLNSQRELDASDRANYTICRDLYRSYILHCKDNNRPPVSDNVFGSYLIAKGIKKERRRVNGIREYCYIGISVL